MKSLFEKVILNAREIEMKIVVLTDLIDRLYDGIGKEVIEKYLATISEKLSTLILEIKLIKDDISEKKSKKF